MSATRAGSILLVVLVMLGAVGPWVAPHDPDLQPDPAAGRYLPPGSARILLAFTDGSTRLAESATLEGTQWSIERLGVVAQVDAASLVAPPKPVRFLLGTDQFGRDLGSRLLAGARISLMIGALATLLALGLGTAVGALAAQTGGVVDLVVMRLTEGLLAFPRLLLVLVASALWRLDLAALIVLLGTTSWMETARLVRARLLAEQTKDYVAAATVAGLPRSRILLRHLLPNALSPLLADGALRVGDVILLEAALSYLGFGVPAPAASWGRMVAEGQDALAVAWWAATLPGIAIALTVLAFALIADGLRDRLDPGLAHTRALQLGRPELASAAPVSPARNG